MTKEEALQAMMLLSALESWSFAKKHRPPDYLQDELLRIQNILRREILKRA